MDIVLMLHMVWWKWSLFVIKGLNVFFFDPSLCLPWLQLSRGGPGMVWRCGGVERERDIDCFTVPITGLLLVNKYKRDKSGILAFQNKEAWI